jgi:hypothetical protein
MGRSTNKNTQIKVISSDYFNSFRQETKLKPLQTEVLFYEIKS